ncbi:MAG: glycosyltransferase family A protein [Caldilineaceae bacterium]
MTRASAPSCMPRTKASSAARNTGMRASTGAIIALLDGDDLFLADKAARQHVAFLDAHPEIGVSYNARFELSTTRP